MKFMPRSSDRNPKASSKLNVTGSASIAMQKPSLRPESVTRHISPHLTDVARSIQKDTKKRQAPGRAISKHFKSVRSKAAEDARQEFYDTVNCSDMSPGKHVTDSLETEGSSWP